MTVSALAVTKMGSLLVVEVATTPPPLSTDVGGDLGLTSLAALSTWGCHRETRGTPLQGARSGPSATRSGPEGRGRTTARRPPHGHSRTPQGLGNSTGRHHKLSLRLIRDHQAVYVGHPAVSGLDRTGTWRSPSMTPAGSPWSELEEGPKGCDRQAVRVGCWFPSSQLYSHCGLGQVRNRYGSGMDQRWVRGHARPTHDRDTNAAAGL